MAKSILGGSLYKQVCRIAAFGGERDNKMKSEFYAVAKICLVSGPLPCYEIVPATTEIVVGSESGSG